ncbi:hypothetical protein NONO_c31240 [Nocardia nova SH22a]|uniref:Uncharacterized protein n=1 Tax=Nocardia nova SH22a TaxID=1415166 RepID=W5TL23_9NOCA|nr:hypothetical protein [Nocardia nova]AHH17911.1 hypothetical protein NONO_c31240 [Nocardia nova SH22a]
MVDIRFLLDATNPLGVLAEVVHPVLEWLKYEHGNFDAHLRPDPVRDEPGAIVLHIGAESPVGDIEDWLTGAPGITGVRTEPARPVAYPPVRATLSAALSRVHLDDRSQTPLHCAVAMLSAVADSHPAGRDRGLISYQSHYAGLTHNLLTAGARERMQRLVEQWIGNSRAWLDRTVPGPSASSWNDAVRWSYGFLQGCPEHIAADYLGTGPAPVAGKSEFHSEYLPLVDEYNAPWFRANRVLNTVVYSEIFPMIGIDVKQRIAATGIITTYSRMTGWDHSEFFEKMRPDDPVRPIENYLRPLDHGMVSQ